MPRDGAKSLLLGGVVAAQLAYLMTANFWPLVVGKDAGDPVTVAVDRVGDVTGQQQQWSMFVSPKPPDQAAFCNVVIEYRDGTIHEQPSPILTLVRDEQYRIPLWHSRRYLYENALVIALPFWDESWDADPAVRDEILSRVLVARRAMLEAYLLNVVHRDDIKRYPVRKATLRGELFTRLRTWRSIDLATWTPEAGFLVAIGEPKP